MKMPKWLTKIPFGLGEALEPVRSNARWYGPGYKERPTCPIVFSQGPFVDTSDSVEVNLGELMDQELKGEK